MRVTFLTGVEPLPEEVLLVLLLVSELLILNLENWKTGKLFQKDFGVTWDLELVCWLWSSVILSARSYSNVFPPLATGLSSINLGVSMGLTGIVTLCGVVSLVKLLCLGGVVSLVKLLCLGPGHKHLVLGEVDPLQPYVDLSLLLPDRVAGEDVHVLVAGEAVVAAIIYTGLMFSDFVWLIIPT